MSDKSCDLNGELIIDLGGFRGAGQLALIWCMSHEKYEWHWWPVCPDCGSARCFAPWEEA
jgi:hypothetical protein